MQHYLPGVRLIAFSITLNFIVAACFFNCTIYKRCNFGVDYIILYSIIGFVVCKIMKHAILHRIVRYDLNFMYAVDLSNNSVLLSQV